MRLLIDTGYGIYWNKDNYVLNGPNYAPSALEWICEQDPSIFGVDVPCIEGQWSEGVEEGKGGLLSKLFKNDAILVAPTCESGENQIAIRHCLLFYLSMLRGVSGGSGESCFYR